MKKLFCSVVVLLSGLNFLLSQPDDEDSQMHLSGRLATTQTKSYFENLHFDYNDQASHNFSRDFSLPRSQNTYGGEFCMAFTTLKKWYFEPLAMGLYFNKRITFVSFCTGGGYTFSPLKNRKLRITPSANIGYANFSYFLGVFQATNSLRTKINGAFLNGNPSAWLIHNSLIVTPQLSIDWYFSEELAIRLRGGYRFDLASIERVRFQEQYTATGNTNSKYRATTSVPANVAIEQSGNYVSSKCMNLSGTSASIGILFTF